MPTGEASTELPAASRSPQDSSAAAPVRSSMLHPRSSSSPPRRPVIAVTGPDTGGEAAWLFTWLQLSLAGASARWVTPQRPGRIDEFDGLIIGGGADVDPRLYGQDLTPMLASTSETRRPLHLRVLD